MQQQQSTEFSSSFHMSSAKHAAAAAGNCLRKHSLAM
jgi:hypothetical protein